MSLTVYRCVLLIGWFLFFCAHAFFQSTKMYWHVPPLDVVMHVLGGLLIVFTTDQILRHPVFLPNRGRWYSQPIFLLLLAAITWEIGKYYFGTVVIEGYVFDTVLDLISGLLGGGIALLILRRG